VEADLAWRTEPVLRSGAQQHDGEPERQVVENDAFLDHHIEEMLGTFSDAVRMPGSGDTEGQRLQ
jgi:hypothetical protein